MGMRLELESDDWRIDLLFSCIPGTLIETMALGGLGTCRRVSRVGLVVLSFSEESALGRVGLSVDKVEKTESAKER